jgi:hypothetical protein
MAVTFVMSLNPPLICPAPTIQNILTRVSLLQYPNWKQSTSFLLSSRTHLPVLKTSIRNDVIIIFRGGWDASPLPQLGILKFLECAVGLLTLATGGLLNIRVV